MHEAVRSKRGPQSRKELVAACHQLRSHVRARRLATDEELNDIWPARPARATVWDWHYAHAQLVRFNAREEARSLAADSDLTDRIAIQALSDEPERLELTDGTTVQVFPKSLHALLWLDHKDQLLTWLTKREHEIRAAMEAGTLDAAALPAPADVLERIRAEIAFQLASVAAVACTGGSRLDEAVAAAPPAPFDDLSPVDLIRIHLKFVAVNVVRLQVARSLVEPPKKGGRGARAMTWATLVSTAADRLRTDARALARDRSLVSLLLQVHLAQRPDLDALEEG